MNARLVFFAIVAALCALGYDVYRSLGEPWRTYHWVRVCVVVYLVVALIYMIKTRRDRA